MDKLRQIIFQDETEANSYDIKLQEQPKTKTDNLCENENDPKMLNNGLTLDFSQKELKIFPQYVFENYKNLTVLYFEGNCLEDLPEIFFPCLTWLKWLDVRKNKLKEIPKNIAGHECLEVLLLQENQIRQLPLELGLVPNLRGVQLLGNPIEFPPDEVLSKGVHRMLRFLREEWNIQSSSNIRPIEEPFYKKPSPPKEMKTKPEQKWKPKLKKSCKIKSSDSDKSNSVPELSVVSYNPLPAPSRNASAASPLRINHFRDQTTFSQNTNYPRAQNWGNHSLYVLDDKVTFPDVIKKDSTNSSQRDSEDAKIYNNLLKEMWISKIKEMLNKQSLIIQRRKDEETLKAWRKNIARLKEMREFQDLGPYEFTVPYDVNEDYMTMLSRFDISNPSLRAGKKKKLKKPTKTVAQEMSEVFLSLQKLQEKKSGAELSPRSEQEALTAEIQMLANLQKRLQALKFKNTKDDVVFSREQLNPIIVKGVGSVPNE